MTTMTNCYVVYENRRDAADCQNPGRVAREGKKGPSAANGHVGRMKPVCLNYPDQPDGYLDAHASCRSEFSGARLLADFAISNNAHLLRT